VETLCAVKHIVEMGPAEFAKLGTHNNTGTRIVSLSGQVMRPGYYEVEIGKVISPHLALSPRGARRLLHAIFRKGLDHKQSR
jgi:NADH:ubiquinone oxidoreductase subunit F (NADH-binding)